MASFEAGVVGVGTRLRGDWGWRLPRSSEAVPQARERARDRMRALGQPTAETETAALLMTEMASNALRHGEGYWWWCQIQHQPARDQVLLRALNGLPRERRHPPRPAELAHRVGIGDTEEPGGPAECGRGLLLMAALAKEWDIQTGRTSCLVWAALPTGR